MPTPRLSTSSTAVYFIDEVIDGTTPAAPAWEFIRSTGETLAIKRDSKVSEELNPGRNVADAVFVKGEATGAIKFEWSHNSFDKLLETVMWSSWVADVISNGIERKPKSIEVVYDGGAPANDVYKRVNGAYISEFELSAKSGDFAAGSFNIMGRAGIYDTAPIVGATYGVGNTEPVLSNVDFGAIAMTGVTIDCITEISLKINNNLRTQHCLGTIHPTGIGYGQFDVEGDIGMYLSRDQYNVLTAFLAQNTVGMSFTLGTVTLKKTKFDIPRAKLTDVTVVADGGNNDLMIKGKFRGLRSVAGPTLTLTRNVV